jgi:MFS family permease
MQKGSVWRNVDFVKLWLAITLSQLGIQITFLGIPLIAIEHLKATPLEVSFLNTLIFLPSILIGLFAGVWVDKMKRRPILIFSDIGRGLILLSIPLAFILGNVLSIWQLYIVGFLNGFLTVFFDVAYRSYLPSLIDRKQLISGNSALEAGNSGSQIAGASITGFLIAAMTAPIAIMGNVLTFILSFVLLLVIRKREPSPAKDMKAKGESSSNMRKEIGDGFRYVFRHRLIRPLVLYGASVNLGWSMVEGIYMVYFVRHLGIEASMIGIIFGISNLGLVVGAICAGLIASRIGIGLTILISGVLQGLGIMLIPLAPETIPIPFLITGLLMRSFGIIVSNINQTSLRQSITPESMLGRVNGTLRFMGWGTIPMGYVLGGAVATFVGLKLTLWIGAMVSFMAVLPIFLSPVRKLYTIPQQDSEVHF